MIVGFRRRLLSFQGAVVAAAAVFALTVSMTPASASSSLERLAGEDRYETATVIADRDYGPGADIVFLALGTEFSDALAGAPAAAVEGGPILLSKSGRLSSSTREELVSLAPERVQILGGEKALGTNVVDELAEVLPHASVERVAGDNRFATSVAISRKTFEPGVASVFIVNGDDYPDALTAGPVAGAADAPVLLVKRGAVPKIVRDELERLNPGQIFILGGTSAVKDKVAVQLNQYTEGKSKRLNGKNRFETAVSISKASFPNGADTIYLATGEDFPDALAGGPAASIDGAPILLTKGDSVPQVTRAEIRRLAPSTIVVLGGTEVISKGAANQAANPKEGEPKPGEPGTTPPKHAVHPGAFCSTEGAEGFSKTGKPMVCSSVDGDVLRWRGR